jgi:HEAT repeat protein
LPIRQPRADRARQVADVLRRQIHSGAYDDALPSETALATEFSVSRNTVRAALTALKAVEQALRAPAWQVREGAARALAGAVAEQAVPRLSQILVDEHLDVRKAAVLSLSRWADSEIAARDALSVALKDDDADVWAYARRALGSESG